MKPVGPGCASGCDVTFALVNEATPGQYANIGHIQLPTQRVKGLAFE